MPAISFGIVATESHLQTVIVARRRLVRPRSTVGRDRRILEGIAPPGTDLHTPHKT